GNQISRIETPGLAAAAGKSLDYRIANGGGGTGWSAAWLINQYARLGDGDKAKSSLETVLSKSTAANLFGLHPPFQMDANFGTTAGVAEMLLQSHAGAIELLPALPKAWPTGKITGLKARGGIEVDIEWSHGKLDKLVLKSDYDQTVKIRYHKMVVYLDLTTGEVMNLDGSLGKY